MFDEIFKIVFKETRVTKKELLSNSRKSNLVESRALFIALSLKSGFSYYKIGKEINRDHSSIKNLYSSRADHPFIIKAVNRNLENIQCAPPKKEGVFRLEKPENRYASLYEKYAGRCMICGFDEVVEVYHILSTKLGGDDTLENLLLLCPNHFALANKKKLSYTLPNGSKCVDNSINNK